jgi:choline dehydrogenase-like flavoprotein
VPDDRHHDVMIVGFGAGERTLAHRLAPSGKQVLLLERGDHLLRERDDWSSTAVFGHGEYRATGSWCDADGEEFPSEVDHHVEGPTRSHGAALVRLRPEDSGERRHHGGVSPAWPISPSSGSRRSSHPPGYPAGRPRPCRPLRTRTAS